MSRLPLIDVDHGKLLSAAMKAVRRKKGLRSADVAMRMDIPQRTYEYIEAGKGGLTYDRLISFGKATDSDPYGLLAALATSIPELAAWVADNKLALVITSVLREFAETLGEQVAQVDAMTAVAILSRAATELANEVQGRLEREQLWMSEQMESDRPRRKKP